MAFGDERALKALLTISSATSLAGRPENNLENLWSKSMRACAKGRLSDAYVFSRLRSALPLMTRPSFQHWQEDNRKTGLGAGYEIRYELDCMCPSSRYSGSRAVQRAWSCAFSAEIPTMP